MFSTTLGLPAVALRGDPAMKVLSPADVSAGLPAPSAAAALLGKGGAAALLVVLFLAVTSATSAELIAVSSILTFDVYKVTFLGIDLYSRHTKMLLCQYLELLQPKGYRAADPLGVTCIGMMSSSVSSFVSPHLVSRLLSLQWSWAFSASSSFT